MINTSMKEIIEYIYSIEEEYNLFDLKIKDIFIWKLIRIHVVNYISIECECYEKSFVLIGKSKLKKLKVILNQLANRHKNNILRNKSQKDVIIFENPRKIKIDGKYNDLYTHDYVSKYIKKNKKYEFVDIGYFGKHYQKPDEYRSYGDIYSFKDYLFYIFKLKAIKFDENEKKIINLLEKKISEKFCSSIKLEKIIKKRIVIFNISKNYFNKIINIKKPKQVYLVNSSEKEALISACKDNNVESIEFQHGVISKYSVAYNFNNKNKIPYFPDKILLFGEYWYDSCKFPILKKDIEFIGYSYLLKQHSKYSTIEKKHNQVLVVSQGTIGNKLSKIIYDFALENNDIEINYKLHPGEFERWRDEYKYLVDLEKLDNVTVYKDEKNLYELFSTAEYVIGVYSTALYESFVMNCSVILINLSGIEYMEYLIKENYVYVANNGYDIKNIIKNKNKLKIESNYFFKN